MEQYIGSRCGNCGQSVSRGSSRCPHCGVYFSGEKKEYREVSVNSFADSWLAIIIMAVILFAAVIGICMVVP